MGRFNVWIVLLLASVLLNGVLIGAMAREGFAPAAAPEAHERGERRGRGGFDLRSFVRALPEDVREETRGRFDAARPDLHGLRREAFEARRGAVDALGAEDFDVEAAAAALAEARRARTDLEAAIERVVLEAVADLDAETRRDALREALGPRTMRREGRDRPAPDADG